MRGTDSKKLVNGLIARDECAWVEFRDTYSPFIRAAIAKVFGSARLFSDIDDIESDVYVELMESRLAQWDGRCSLASWVSTLASSRAKDALDRSQADDHWRTMNIKSPLFPDVNTNPADKEQTPAWVYQTDYDAFSSTGWYWADWMFGSLTS